MALRGQKMAAICSQAKPTFCDTLRWFWPVFCLPFYGKFIFDMKKAFPVYLRLCSLNLISLDRIVHRRKSLPLTKVYQVYVQKIGQNVSDSIIGNV